MFAIAPGAARARLTRSFVNPRLLASLHTLPNLPYAYDALEPHISEEIMKLHHQKHHQTYVNGLNAAEEAYAMSECTKSRIALQSALKFNGGGHINHSLFWKNLAPAGAEGSNLSEGPLKEAIVSAFGSVETFKKSFNTTTAAIQGSGWGWLGYNPTTQKVEIITTSNQDPLLSHVPIIGVDIWEHAFYLQVGVLDRSAAAALTQTTIPKYKNVKPDYLNAIWNVINFKEAERRLLEVTE